MLPDTLSVASNSYSSCWNLELHPALPVMYHELPAETRLAARKTDLLNALSIETIIIRKPEKAGFSATDEPQTSNLPSTMVEECAYHHKYSSIKILLIIVR